MTMGARHAGYLAGVAICAVVVAAPAVAQQRQFNVPAQDARTGIPEFGRQANVQISAPTGKLVNKRTNAVSGSLTIRDGLEKLIEGTGLSVASSNDRLIVLKFGGSEGNAAAAPARSEVSASGSDVVVAPLPSAGTVVDARTGAALKGALVEIVETGEMTSTGNLGEYRFPGKTGRFNIRVSYLGYPEYEQLVELKDGRATAGIILSDDSATTEIIVTAHQSARAQALNQERTADNVSTVISADLLGRLDGTTISETLRHAPGVAFERDVYTNDGTNVIIRGLGSGFNTVTLNGLRLPVGDGANRSPNLGNILTDSVSQITINKTLLPNQDGSGTGGLVDIETKGPLDRPRRYASFSIEKAQSGKKFLDDFSAGGTISAIFGSAHNFGVSANVQYRRKSVRSLSSAGGLIVAPYLPATENGRLISTPFDLDQRRAFPFEPDADYLFPASSSSSYGYSKGDNLSVVIGSQFKIGNHTDLKLDLSYLKNSTDRLSRSVVFTPIAGYTNLPIDALNGEVRPAYVWENFIPGLGLYAFNIHQGSGALGETQMSKIASFNGETNLGRWQIKYKGGYALGENNSPNVFAYGLSEGLFFDRGHLDSQVAANMIDGHVVTPFSIAPDVPVFVPGLNQSGFDFINARSGLGLDSATVEYGKSSNERYTGSASAQYKFASHTLNYVEAGLFWEQSTNRGKANSSGGDGYSPAQFGLPIEDYGLSIWEGGFANIGVPFGIEVPTEAAVRSFIEGLETHSQGASPLLVKSPFGIDALASLQKTVERDYGGYIQTKLNIGRLDIIGGVRFEWVDTNSVFVRTDTLYDENGVLDFQFLIDSRRIEQGRARRLDVLPRVMANFRFSDSLVMRMGYYSSIARPNISQLNQGSNVTLNLQRIPFFGNRPTLQISRGNPNLKASVTHNLDLSLEYYDKDVGSAKIGLFYKPTVDAFFSTTTVLSEGLGDVELPSDPRFQNLPADILIQQVVPQNSKFVAKAWGAEISVEKRLKFLPGPLSGLGVYANYTYSHSSRVLEGLVNYFDGSSFNLHGVPYATQPDHSGTLGITYERAGLDAGIFYTAQSNFLVSPLQFGRAQYAGGNSSLDMRLSYETSFVGTQLSLFLAGSDLLKGTSDPSARGSEAGLRNRSRNITTSAAYFGGRSIRVGATVRF